VVSPEGRIFPGDRQTLNRSLPLFSVPALLHYGFSLAFQKNPECDAVRDQQQRHNESRNEVGRSQLPWLQPRGSKSEASVAAMMSP
jgi:hypothetical protein